MAHRPWVHRLLVFGGRSKPMQPNSVKFFFHRKLSSSCSLGLIKNVLCVYIYQRAALC
uniref:Uncharacterized protein n=1 Tax=Anguilla anguilla TaxID=7936 RepID=A0A0E9SVV2_ANGAN